VAVLRIALVAAAFAGLGLSGPAGATGISGAGATFPYPVYAKWAEAFKAKTGTNMNYQSIGSGGGIKQIAARTVDFGASDMPLKPEALAKDGLVQWPMVMGGVVLVVNLKGIAPGQLKLDGMAVAGIYLGRIAKWNDPAIAALNPGAALPDKAIAPIHRSDAKVSRSWRDTASVRWLSIRDTTPNATRPIPGDRRLSNLEIHFSNRPCTRPANAPGPDSTAVTTGGSAPGPVTPAGNVSSRSSTLPASMPSLSTSWRSSRLRPASMTNGPGSTSFTT